MHLQALVSVLALCKAAVAFSDSSPLVLFSTSTFATPPNVPQIQSSFQVLSYTKGFLSKCPTDRYLVALQPGLKAADIRQSSGYPMPSLYRSLEDNRIKGMYSVSEVVGEMADAGFLDYIKSACAKKGKEIEVEEVRLASLSSDDRVGTLSENDNIFAQRLEFTMESDSFTIIFLSTPQEPAYKSDFIESFQTDLKRQIQGTFLQGRENITKWDTLPLFEKYQFFTPGIFMAILTVAIILYILGVGLKALGSLEVSYAAFEKGLCPAAQKKHQ